MAEYFIAATGPARPIVTQRRAPFLFPKFKSEPLARQGAHSPQFSPRGNAPFKLTQAQASTVGGIISGDVDVGVVVGEGRTAFSRNLAKGT